MKISIKKFDPTLDEKPYFQEYDVPLVEYMTLLQALVYIDENFEPLALDYSCRGRTCGRCAMMLNGEACTACTTPLKEGSYTVEPLAGFPVIRDLVVDKKPVQDKISAIARRSNAQEITWERLQEPVDMHAYDVLGAVERCARCLVCHTSCPVVQMTPDRFIGPTGMVAVALRYYDPYDDSDRVRQAVDLGLWNCTMCGICDEVCPALEIDHLAIYQEIRDEATSKGLTDMAVSALRMGEKIE